jgi:hypothetical protein
MAEWICVGRRFFHGCLCHISLAKKKQKPSLVSNHGEGLLIPDQPQLYASAPATNLPREAQRRKMEMRD